ncbi:glycoside hydrolase family 31 protein [Neofusicoccum parvum]|nr:glycoside hydrolase family 31 protein [Neofusicoccum parvum]
MGFGGQGGKNLTKDQTYMNYFNFDNMRYNNIYAKGPEEGAEPLYHSEPFWIEANRHPGYMSQVATFIDNYSHVCLDIGKTDNSSLRIATRFNSFQGIFMAGNNIAEVIRLYTSIIGKPRLMPRYVLGYHQGCYGYDRQWKVEEVVRQYRQHDFPLDGMHIDVDIQRGYRTFTIDRNRFPEPEEMFSKLRDQGVRCSTNITPVINCTPDPTELDPSAPRHHDQRYMQYGNADLYFTNPNAVDRRPYPDSYDFAAHFNKSVPFHGGVSYGDGQGAPGHYPNLNNKHTRDWWGEQYKDLFDAGLEFVWQDMTSPCIGEAYGDMKSWPFRLLLDSDDWPGEQRQRRLSNAAAIHHKYELKTAIELWSLYSLNLHKATFKGLKQLDSRKGKRNFIIGRGSFAGAQRYAGLWTGDNASTWEFLKVSVAQVLSLGLSGMTIAGADVGGFELAFGEENFASPELLIRWYCTNSLLPWFRNHYSGRHEPFEDNPNQPRDTDKKLFQEPYKYEEYYRDNKDRIPEHERRVYEAVLPVCRYYVRLRYSLMQLLYDTMFESTITGLPIARAMIITDPSDGSLFTKNEPYTHTQYLAGNDILVAPALQTESLSPRRQVYLPSSSAIIPTIRVRPSVPDRTRPSLPSPPCNPITINVYPGRDNAKPTTYRMYLDDGVSRSSAPDPTYFAALPHHHHGHSHDAFPARPNNAHGDGEARGNFRRVDVKQRIRTVEADNPRSGAVLTRTITVATGWDGAAGKEGEQAPEEGWYDDARVRRDVGGEYRVVVWHEAGTRMEGVVVEVVGAEKARREVDEGRRASVVWVPVDAGVKTTIRVRVIAVDRDC